MRAIDIPYGNQSLPGMEVFIKHSDTAYPETPVAAYSTVSPNIIDYKAVIRAFHYAGKCQLIKMIVRVVYDYDI